MKISKERFNAFNDGVMAIIITIMVLDLHIPEAFTVDALATFGKDIFTYFASFLLVANRWYKHAALTKNSGDELSGKIVLHNLLFLFLLSLVPPITKWILVEPESIAPVLGYIVLFVLLNTSYKFLSREIYGKDVFEKTIQDKKHQKIKNPVKRVIWIAIPPISLAGFIACSIYVPDVSNMFLVILPLRSYLSELWFDEVPAKS